MPQLLSLHSSARKLQLLSLRATTTEAPMPRARALFFFLIIIYLFIFLAVLGLSFCVRAFSSCVKRGPLFITVHGPLTIAASLTAEHRLQTRRLSNCGSRAQSLRGMWDPPRPGLEPASPALAGRFPTTAPPGKPEPVLFNKRSHYNEKPLQ